MDIITSLSSQSVGKALDGLAKRNTAIASNLANVDTPGYQRKDVTFEGNLQRAIARRRGLDGGDAGELAMKATRPNHFNIGAPPDFNQPMWEETEADAEYRNDGNSVDVDTEMVNLAKNTQRYIALANLEGRMMSGLKSVISNSGGV